MILTIGDDGVITDFHIPSSTTFTVDCISSVGKHMSDVLPVEVVKSILNVMEIIHQGGEPQKRTFTFDEGDYVHSFEGRLLRYNDCFMAIGRVIA